MRTKAAKAPSPFALASLMIIALAPAPSLAQQAEKSRYNLFNPTPKALMRDLATDRPDRTENPFTVDAGHFQIESDLIIVSRDKETESGVTTKTEESSYLLTNFKVGLTNSLDLQLFLAPFNERSVEATGAKDTRRGFGDTVVRLKWNIFGNDLGPVAMGLMPFAKIATAQDDLGNKRIEPGVILPLNMELPAGWGLGTMLQWRRLANTSDDENHNEFVSTMAFGHGLIGNLAGFIELYSESSDEPGAAWVATFDSGLTWKATPDIQVDGGVNLGLTKPAPDYNPFLGLSARF